MADQAGGYAVISQPQAPVKDGMHFGGGAAWILVWVVVIIIIIALLAAVFWGNSWSKDNDSSSDDDRRHKKDSGFDLSLLGGLVVFVIVILFLCWLIGSAGSVRC